jgi:hypothetical protein
MAIPKYPEVPILTQKQIEEITEIVFGIERGTNNIKIRIHTCFPLKIRLLLHITFRIQDVPEP